MTTHTRHHPILIAILATILLTISACVPAAQIVTDAQQVRVDYQHTATVDDLQLHIQAAQANEVAARAAATSNAYSVMLTATPIAATQMAERTAAAVTQHANATAHSMMIQQTAVALDIIQAQATQNANEVAAQATQHAQHQAAVATSSANATRMAYDLASTQIASSITATAASATQMAPHTLTPAAATAVALAVAMRTDQQRASRAQWTPIAWLFVVIAGITATAVALWQFAQAIIDTRRMITTSDGTAVYIHTGTKRQTMILPQLQAAPALTINGSAPQLAGGHLDDQLQHAIIARRQAVELMNAQRGQVRRPAAQTPQLPAPAITVTDPGVPDQAPWHLFDVRNGVPFGLSADGLLLPHHAPPHRLAAGRTGSGKTSGALRPFVAGSLATGAVVVNVAEDGQPDFAVFKTHQNYHQHMLHNPADATNLLRSAYAEIKRRRGQMENARQPRWHTWTNAPAPVVVLVFDEFTALADSVRDMAGSSALRDFFSMAANVARKGRSAGIWLALGAQDPTAQNMRITIRRNASAQCFAVQDDAASRVVIGQPGAESLSTGQFLLRTGDDIHAGRSFQPDDNQITNWLTDHRTAPLPAPGWLTTADTGTADTDTDDKRQAVLDAYQRTGSISATQRAVYGDSGGANFYRTRRQLADAGLLDATQDVIA